MSSLSQLLKKHFEIDSVICCLHNKSRKVIIRRFELAIIVAFPKTFLGYLGFFRFILNKVGDFDYFFLNSPSIVSDFLVVFLRGARSKKVLVTFHCDICSYGWLGKIYMLGLVWCFRRFAGDIATTSANLREGSFVLSRLKQRVILVFPLFLPDESVALLRGYGAGLDDKFVCDSRFDVIFIGGARAYKGLSVLFELIENTQYVFAVVGTGLRERAIEYFGDDIPMRLKIFEKLPDSDKGLVLRRSDILVLPSINASEAFGVVLLEAMSLGKPVVSTELGTGTSWVNVNRETGLVVTPGRWEEIADAILMIRSNALTYQRYCHSSLERFNSVFSEAAALENYRTWVRNSPKN